MDPQNPSFWECWQPTMRASLCFVRKEGKILMIRKKRGLGAGKINGPGGRLEPGETPLQAAIRETEEELLVTPLQLSERGELHFQFTDGLALHCVVFSAEGCLGEPKETDEAIPHWMPPPRSRITTCGPTTSIGSRECWRESDSRDTSTLTTTRCSRIGSTG